MTEDEGVAAWAAFLRAHAATVQRISIEVEAATGLPLSWYDVLLELNRAPGRRLRMRELGETVVLSRTRVSRIVDEMESEGLVRRLRDETDGRSSFAVITDSGRAWFRRTAPVYLRTINARFGSHLSRQEVRMLRRVLERIESANLPPVRLSRSSRSRPDA